MAEQRSSKPSAEGSSPPSPDILLDNSKYYGKDGIRTHGTLMYASLAN